MRRGLRGPARIAAVLAIAAAASASLSLVHPGGAAADSHCMTSGDETLCAIDITTQPGSEFDGNVGTDTITNDPFGILCSILDSSLYTLDWGDGSQQPAVWSCTSDGGIASLALSGTHIYAAAGSYTVTITSALHSDSPVSASATAQVGPGASPPALGLSPTTIAFGNQAVGVTSAPQTITVTNTAEAGAQSLQLGALTTGGANASDFSLLDDTCSNASVAPGSSCTVDVAFAPSASGARSGSVSLPSNAADSPGTVTLGGTGTTTTPSADVQVGISGPSSAKRGAQVSYVITVSNAGPSTAHDVVMSDPTPDGATLVGVRVSQGVCAVNKAGRITCSLGDLPSGGSDGSVVSVKLTAKVGGTVGNLASAYSTTDAAGPATPDPDTSNNWATVTTTVAK